LDECCEEEINSAGNMLFEDDIINGNKSKTKMLYNNYG